MSKFFSEISQYAKEFHLDMKISQNDETITVSLRPLSKSKAVDKNAFPPLILNGTPEDLDNGFFEAIKNAMSRTAGIVKNVEFYGEQMKAAEEKAKTDAAKKHAAKSAATPAKAETKPADDLFATTNEE